MIACVRVCARSSVPNVPSAADCRTTSRWSSDNRHQPCRPSAQGLTGNLGSDEVGEMTFSDVTQRFYQTFVSGTNRQRSKVGLTKSPVFHRRAFATAAAVAAVSLAFSLPLVQIQSDAQLRLLGNVRLHHWSSELRRAGRTRRRPR